MRKLSEFVGGWNWYIACSVREYRYLARIYLCKYLAGKYKFRSCEFSSLFRYRRDSSNKLIKDLWSNKSWKLAHASLIFPGPEKIESNQVEIVFDDFFFYSFYFMYTLFFNSPNFVQRRSSLIDFALAIAS